MTVFANRETFLMRRTLATDPARCVGPCITLASSSTSESSFGSSSTTVTAATTASNVSPPFLRMSMPLSRACSPFALEIISGRLPCAAGARFGRAAKSLPFECEPPNNLPALATALPASEVRKNLRRDHSSMGNPSSVCAPQYTTLVRPQLSDGLSGGWRALHRFERRASALAGSCSFCGKFSFPARNHYAGDAISENSDRSSAHIHELIDREQKK